MGADAVTAAVLALMTYKVVWNAWLPWWAVWIAARGKAPPSRGVSLFVLFEWSLLAVATLTAWIGGRWLDGTIHPLDVALFGAMSIVASYALLIGGSWLCRTIFAREHG